MYAGVHTGVYAGGCVCGCACTRACMRECVRACMLACGYSGEINGYCNRTTYTATVSTYTTTAIINLYKNFDSLGSKSAFGLPGLPDLKKSTIPESQLPSRRPAAAFRRWLLSSLRRLLFAELAPDSAGMSRWSFVEWLICRCEMRGEQS